ncbi:polyprotein [Plakobranchus ocellatus]|uniref:Polyprotein n=1 Tax=Plakobranchus ocellatus TaxID=259542 RepID=A0AAV3ZL35_9GAST|nr:polyprotein [Plakobranchus ocellatus]
MLTETAPRTTRTKTTNVGLEMDYSCICGRRFATERGMKIHRTKMGCVSMSSQQQRTAIADKTMENQSKVQNHSAEEIQAEHRDDVARHLSSDKRHKINFPPASSGKQWEDLDSKIVLKIYSLLGKSTLEHKLATFGDIVYQTCLDTFGAKQHQTKCPPQRSRRQLEMDTLRKQKRKLKKQIRAANEIRNKEDSTRVQKAVQQPQQGQWINWDTAIQRSLTWNDIWHMAPLRISFLIRSVYDLLPSNANLVRWGKKDDPTCPLCQGRQTTELVLSSCKVALSQGRYTWRHNRVLQELASVISTAKGEIHPSSTSSTVFITEGGVKKCHGGSIPINTHRKGLLDGCDDWVVSADFHEWERHPDVIRKTALRPDIVIHSASTQQIIMVELTVPYESRMEEVHAFKEAKYLELSQELRKGWLRS